MSNSRTFIWEALRRECHADIQDTETPSTYLLLAPMPYQDTLGFPCPPLPTKILLASQPIWGLKGQISVHWQAFRGLPFQLVPANQ